MAGVEGPHEPREVRAAEIGWVVEIDINRRKGPSAGGSLRGVRLLTLGSDCLGRARA